MAVANLSSAKCRWENIQKKTPVRFKVKYLRYIVSPLPLFMVSRLGSSSNFVEQGMIIVTFHGEVEVAIYPPPPPMAELIIMANARLPDEVEGTGTIEVFQ